MKEISFRTVTMEDADLLLAWRNDPDTRANSIRSDPVPIGEHMDWMHNIVGSQDNIFLIAESQGKPIGCFRMDKFTIYEINIVYPGMRLISYVVAPKYRRQGYGTAIVAEGIARYGEQFGFIAKVKNTNIASKKIFENAGFDLLGDVEDGIQAYTRPADKQTMVQ